MSRRNLQSPTSQYLSPIKSETEINKSILTQLFSKQFLGCLKDELSSKLKQTRIDQTEHKKALVQLKSYKRQIEKMRRKIQELTQINQQLTQKVNQYQFKQKTSKENWSEPAITINGPQISRKLELSKAISINIIQDETQIGSKDVQIQQLRERIEKLEITKSIKDQRLNELLEKEVRFDSQIKILKIKNDELEDEVKSLRETVIIQTEDEKALKNTLNSQKHPDIAISYHFMQADTPKKEFQKVYSNNSSNNLNLIASFTNNVQIPQSMDIGKAYLKKHLTFEQREYNQIDDIIAEELPYLSVSAELNPLQASQQAKAIQNQNSNVNLNQSIVLINLNH